MCFSLLQLVVVVGAHGVLLCVFRPVAASDGCLCLWSVAVFSDLFQLAMVVGVYAVLLCDLRSVAASDGCLCIWSVAVCFQIC